jgi:NADH-quinone oxidoreductase subunit E
MKATGNFEACRNVDPQAVLSDATRRTSTTGWPSSRRIASARRDPGPDAAQEQNGGWLTDELIAAVARYLGMPPVWAYEVATFYSMFETRPVGRHNVAFCTNISCWLNGAEDWWRTPRSSWAASWANPPPTAASTSSARRSAWPPAAARR